MDFHTMLADDPKALSGVCVALLGGGGKTGLMLRLGAELAIHYPRVLMTSLTRSAANSESPALLLSGLDETQPLPFGGNNPLLVMDHPVTDGKLAGVSPETLVELLSRSSLAVVECDGSRRLPLKAHNDRDPVTPDCVTHVVVVVGAGVVDTTLDEGKVHRPELFRSRWGLAPDTVLEADFIAEVVTSPQGYGSKITGGQSVVYFVNQADRWPDAAQRLARAIQSHANRPTFWGSIREGFLQAK
ncbi:MAG: selenium cofactor biosynthesis protein YqeC [Candidatus Neomarinimicrobiota bacterium]